MMRGSEGYIRGSKSSHVTDRVGSEPKRFETANLLMLRQDELNQQSKPNCDKVTYMFVSDAALKHNLFVQISLANIVDIGLAQLDQYPYEP